MNKDDEIIRQRNKDVHHNAALHWNTLANEQELELTRQLLYFATIIFPITASFAILRKDLITTEIRIILLFTWFFLLLSIIFGVIQIVINIKYYVYLLKDESKRTGIWSKSVDDIKELQDEEKKLGKTKDSSGNLFLILQGLFIALSFITVLIIAIIILFR
ncbi:hypothetical protein IPM65_02215 [Candidatus Roizmanbacteria bacterium]|nr:MAG: hypothetical protein IPM65_02215 [Candidatus Roizmanbacteria bacterium]